MCMQLIENPAGSAKAQTAVAGEPILERKCLGPGQSCRGVPVHAALQRVERIALERAEGQPGEPAKRIPGIGIDRLAGCEQLEIEHDPTPGEVARQLAAELRHDLFREAVLWEANREP